MAPATPRSVTPRRLLVALIVLLGAGAFVRSKFAPLEVSATPVVRGKAIDAVYATGTVEANDRVNVKAKTAGSIAEILVKEGQAVKRGDLLARIDNPAASFDLVRGQADLSAASAQAGASAPQIAAAKAQIEALTAERDVSRLELARSERLQQSGAIPSAELDRARARVTQLEAQIGALRAQERALRIDLSSNLAQKSAQVKSLSSRVSDTEVRSPLDGVVLLKQVELGEVVAINQPLFKVGDARDLVLEVAVDEADIARVHPADGAEGSAAAVSLYAFPKQVFHGRVFEVLPDANRERKSFLTKVRLDTPPLGLRSGMSAEVNIISGEKPGALLAPSSAEEHGALWVVADGRAELRHVEIGIRDLLRVEVVRGVREGELAITSGHDKLKDGMRVTAIARPADKSEPMPDKSQPSKATL
jgi:multidrug efflux pump subunit AcrA (membrane-fusion protein)